MQIGFETIREILEHRLHQEDMEKLLHGLDEAGKAELFYRITGMLRRTSALAANPEDGPSNIYFERCRIYRSTPPPAAWDGAWTMPNK